MFKRFMLLIFFCIVLFVLANTVAHAQLIEPSAYQILPQTLGTMPIGS